MNSYEITVIDLRLKVVTAIFRVSGMNAVSRLLGLRPLTKVLDVLHSTC